MENKFLQGVLAENPEFPIWAVQAMPKELLDTLFQMYSVGFEAEAVKRLFLLNTQEPK